MREFRRPVEAGQLGQGYFRLSADPTWNVFGYLKSLSDLYLVEGLK